MMKVLAGDLSKGLGAVVRLIEPRNVIPILETVLIEPQLDDLTITAHNLDACSTVSIAADAQLSERPFCVPCAQLHGLVKSLPPNDSVTLTAAGERLTVSWRKSHYKLPLLPVETFPPRLVAEGGIPFDLVKPGVERILGQPAPFVARDGRIFLAGVFLHPDGDRLVGVGCDSVRICRATYPMPECDGEWPKNGERLGVLIPPKIAAELVHWGIDVALRIADGIIESRGYGPMNPVIVSKLIDASYLVYERAIPAPQGHGFTCSRKELGDVAARLAAVAPRLKDATPGAGFSWDGGDTVSVVLARSRDTADDVIIPTEIEGSGRFALQLKQLDSVLVALPGDDVHFDKDPTAAVVRITVPGDDGMTCAVGTMIWSDQGAKNAPQE
jgi:DNA polymerase-3 subunit beta